MNSETAKEVIGVLTACSKMIEESIKRVKASCGERTFIEYRRAAGRVMGYIFTNLLGPLYDEHPELAPDWYNARTPETLRDEAMPKEMREDLVSMMNHVQGSLQDTANFLRRNGDEEAAQGYRKRLDEILGLLESTKNFLGKV